MTFVRPGFPGPQSLICSPMIFHLLLLCCLVVLTFYLSLKNLRGWIQLKPWSKRQLLVASCTAAQAARLTGFREGKSSVSWRLTAWNSKWDDSERDEEGETTRCFPASRRDGRRPPTNKSEVVKRQDAEEGAAVPREETCGECGSRSLAWFSLADEKWTGKCLLGSPSLHSAPPPYFLLLLAQTFTFIPSMPFSLTPSPRCSHTLVCVAPRPADRLCLTEPRVLSSDVHLDADPLFNKRNTLYMCSFH